MREAYEEIGVPAEGVTVLGQLTPLYILPSDFEVHPTVGWYSNGQRPVFIPNQDEVAEVLEVSLRHLMDPRTRGEGWWTIRGYRLLVPYYNVQGHKVWGATAMMLSELIERLKAVNGQ